MSIRRSSNDQFASIVPLVYIPRGFDQEFIYRIPRTVVNPVRELARGIRPSARTGKLHPAESTSWRSGAFSNGVNIVAGQPVTVNFRKKTIQGIVRRTFNKPASLKTILDIKSVLPYLPLTKGQLAIIDTLENYYGASRTLAYKTVVVKFAMNLRLEHKRSHQKIKYPALTETNQQTLLLLLRAKPKLTISGALYDPRHSLFIEYIRQRIKNKGQILLLFPDNESAEIVKESYEKYFNEAALVIWSSQAPIGQLSRDWMRISTGEASIILATRSGPFLPFKSLRAIILFDEADNNYKSWDQQPYYDTRLLAEKLSETEQIPLLTTRLLPPLQSRHQVLSIISRKKAALVTIFDRQTLYKENPKAIIPEEVMTFIGKSSPSEQSLVFINRLGYAALFCRDCGYIFRCQNCDTPLIHVSNQSNGANIRCYKCSHVAITPVFCPQCRCVHLRYFGVGVERIHEELIKQFPHKRIQRLDRAYLKTGPSLQQLLDNIRNHRVDITIATSIILPRLWSLPLFNTTVVLQAESLFLTTGWRAYENGLTALRQLRTATKGHFYVETSLPNHPVIKSLQSTNLKNFFTSELAERKRFNYPPYSRLIKLIAKRSDAGISSNEIGRLGNIETIEIPGPQRIIVLKMPFNISLCEILPYISNKWKIDVDPITLD
ncbi:primosomal protein N' [Candidatus Uhrbacteria bacterium RIFCSPLOWO2_12_FULL_46_10]|uniref:Primosomal protein N n=1 Tax=Candidatus Uhrbacteria bacterium RIFCSPLOWO2_01_FULL_47_25 TaxID=1802402 RepID=A0A1F7UXR6_9BACT|nr:MAG: Primosomal protein N' [Parcubacteria group bacterium GW2011_GWA2_46_9]OGL60708.1 MAG: primosomal protein N' [Candidatus Uhrbacteria bacterium RIFCSPHIGHO2_01_FULL_46_23]OGL70339.1 MAG: primosomal protein N' [Candidatus Uhrbacteria bacterium RIFCSPHIGHO2_02_FULL_47_29]OGL83026.1 MAG: primosomal protein N' [Candidatus Uhrbacteria bacterium RIFCSPLOWO2_01_FULL_47_25]OGL84472.1 MAG: primosomal protein N' [Candidatus Uhrbacteria bacterium RIFCSPLOWO2_02_FULL_46_19]OGL90638.1 MAG: primosomal